MSASGPVFPVKLIPETTTVEALVRDIATDSNKEERDESFALFNLGDVIKKYNDWAKYLPRVALFYATKCNNDQQILKVLATCGASFDCSSQAEIEQVLGLGVPADRIIYANPVKQPSMLKYAAKQGVALMTFDNEEELYKIKRIYPRAKCVLRLLPSGHFKVRLNLGLKFGCPLSAVGRLLEVAQDLNLNVVGISFHVGSRCQEAEAYTSSIKESREAFDIGLQMGFKMHLLDIGGGFPGDDSDAITFKEVAETVNKALAKYFPVDDNIDVIGEPGRYLVTTAVTIAANIIGKRTEFHGSGQTSGTSSSTAPHIKYYINEGMFNWLSFIHFESPDVTLETLKTNETDDKWESSVWGPTCDSRDYITMKTWLPEHQIGEWLYFKSLGAYNSVTACGFNGMPTPRKYYCCERAASTNTMSTFSLLAKHMEKGTRIVFWTGYL